MKVTLAEQDFLSHFANRLKIIVLSIFGTCRLPELPCANAAISDGSNQQLLAVEQPLMEATPEAREKG